jgi:hypothetical protein
MCLSGEYNMLRIVSHVFFLLLWIGCVSQDAPQAQFARSSADEVARQQELARQAAIELARQQELARQAVIQSSIQEREQSRNLIFTTLSHETRMQALRSDSLDLSNQLHALDYEVAAYLMDHKIAVACMGLAGAALSKENEYSDDVENLVTGGAILCGFGLLSATFRREVASVIDNLVQADAQAKNLRSQIGTLTYQISNEFSGSLVAQAKIDSLNTEIQDLRLQLQQPPGL